MWPQAPYELWGSPFGFTSCNQSANDQVLYYTCLESYNTYLGAWVVADGSCDADQWDFDNYGYCAEYRTKAWFVSVYSPNYWQTRTSSSNWLGC